MALQLERPSVNHQTEVTEKNQPPSPRLAEHFVGEGLDPHVTEHLRWGYAAINKFPEVAKRYSVFIGTTLAVMAGGAIIGYKAIELYKHKHGIKNNDDALNGLRPEHFDDAEKEMHNSKNGHNHLDTNRSRFNVGAHH